MGSNACRYGAYAIASYTNKSNLRIVMLALVGAVSAYIYLCVQFVNAFMPAELQGEGYIVFNIIPFVSSFIAQNYELRQTRFAVKNNKLIK